MAVDYASQELQLLLRARQVLHTWLNDRLASVNARFGLSQPDRALRFPSRITLSEPPNLPVAGVQNELPAVFIRPVGTAPGSELTSTQDVQVVLQVDAVIGNPNRTLEDVTNLAKLYVHAVTDVLQDRLRKGCGDDRFGPYATVRGPSGTLPALWFDDQWVVRASDSLAVWLRYEKDTRYSLFPDLPHQASALPTQAAGTLTLQDFDGDPVIADPYLETSLQGPALLSAEAGNTYIIIRDQQHVTTVPGTGAPVALPVGDYVIVVQQADGLAPSYRLSVSPLVGVLVFEDDSGSLELENNTPLSLEDP